MFENFYEQYRKKDLRITSKALKMQRYRKRMLETNLDKIIARATKRKEKLKRKREIVKTYPNDPNMLYYPDLRLWVNKKDLRRSDIRLVLGAIHDNPYWDRGTKVTLLNDLKVTLAKLDKVTPEMMESAKPFTLSVSELKRMGLAKTLHTTQEHVSDLPLLWEELIEKGVLEMDPEIKDLRWDFSEDTEDNEPIQKEESS